MRPLFVTAVLALTGIGDLPGQDGTGAAVPSPEQMNAALGLPLWSDTNLWDDDDATTTGRLGWPQESRTAHDASFRLYPGPAERVLGVRPFSLALYSEDGLVDRVSMVFANKGDIEELIEIDPSLSEGRARLERERQVRDYKKIIAASAEEVAQRLEEILGEPRRDSFGSGRSASEKVHRWDWHDHAILLGAPEGEYVALRIIPRQTADGEAAGRVADSELRERLAGRVERRANGDVIITGIPMVDQGPKGYCVPATWERVLRYLGIEADMYALAMAGATELGGGTSVEAMMGGVNDLVRANGRRVDTSAGRLGIRTVKRDIDAGLPVMWSMYSMPEVNRNINDRTRQRQTVTDWDSYRKMLEAWRKAARSIDTDPENAHVCMIVGYNEETGELAVSDSWGPEYAERWITEEEAQAVSGGRFVVINW